MRSFSVTCRLFASCFALMLLICLSGCYGPSEESSWPLSQTSSSDEVQDAPAAGHGDDFNADDVE